MKVLKHKTTSFYDTMCEWWDKHNFDRVPLSMLPLNVFVCYNSDNEPIYSVNVYNTDSLLCWIGWQISDKDNKNKKGGLDFLINKVVEYLSIEGYIHVFTTSNTPPVERALLNSGFILGDGNVNHYIKNL